MITISGKVLGKKKPLFADWSIPLPPNLGEGGSTSLRDIIGRVVRAEVAAFKARQKDQQTFTTLTARKIQEGAAKGKITSGGSEVGLQNVDEDTAVGVALQAFEDGLYLVIVDGEEKKSLDDVVFMKEDSGIAFVRLTMLAGG